MRKVLIFIATCLLMNSQSSATDTQCQNLEEILQNQEFEALPKETYQIFEKSAVWSKDNDLVAFCSDTLCYVVKTCKTDLKIINVSGVIGGNLEYFGTNPNFQRIENLPLVISNNEAAAIAVWHGGRTNPSEKDDPSAFGAVIQTRIWNKGQRYTTSEPMIFRNDIWHGR